MKTKLAAIVALMFLISLVLEVQPVVNANPTVYPRRFPLNVYFNSPLNETYYTKSLLLNVSLEEVSDCENTPRKASYSLDGQANVSVSLVYNGISTHDGNALPHSHVLGVTNLPPLSDGKHAITVFGEFDYPDIILKNSCTATFAILATRPVLFTLSPENQETYNSSDVPLVFTVNGEYSRLEYSLDNLAIITVASNTTLSSLPNGNHNITVYARNEAGNTGASQTVFFDVEVPESFPVVFVAFSVVVVAVVALAVLIYIRKRKANGSAGHETVTRISSSPFTTC